jgi:hypothetical protein
VENKIRHAVYFVKHHEALLAAAEDDAQSGRDVHQAGALDTI